MAGIAASGVLKKPKDEEDEGNVNEDYLNLFEKEFDVADMKAATIENLLKHCGLKPDKPVREKSIRDKTSPRVPRNNSIAANQSRIATVRNSAVVNESNNDNNGNNNIYNNEND